MIIQLISGPRNISTAMMYSFAQRIDMSVVDEPFYAYYLNETDLDHPGKQDVLKSQSCDPQEVVDQVVFGEYPTPHVFIKNMSKHIASLDLSFCKQTKNILLIRDPGSLITSFAKVIDNPDESEIGLKASWEIFQYLGEETVILNSDLVLVNSESVLSQLCERLEIHFDQSMLSWKPGSRPEDGVWAPYWYKNVHKSTGFQAPKNHEEQFPNHLLQLLEEVQPYFDKLNHFAIKP
jgi:hypothetical protein